MINQDDKIQEVHLIEQNLQNIIFQKQTFQIELSETNSALDEIKKSGDEVFKIIGQLMIKSEKSKIEGELLNKEKILELKIKTLEKQESSFTEKLEKVREEIMGSIKKQPKSN